MAELPGKYDNVHVALHWLTAALIVFMLVMGHFSLAATPNAEAGKVLALRGHMILGSVALVLTLGRLYWKVKHAGPAYASTGSALMDRLGISVQHSLYLMVVIVAGSGIGLALLTGLPGIVFGGGGALPESFAELTPRIVHGIATKILAALIVLHGGGALFHQFVLKDHLFSRMWFGKS